MTTFARLIDDPSPRLRNSLNTLQNGVHFAGELTNTPTGTTQTIDLTQANHQTLDCGSASGDLTVTLTPPAGAASGRLIIKQDDQPRDIAWLATGRNVVWLTTEPDYSQDTSSNRIVSWTDDGSSIYLMSTVSASQVTGLTAWVNVQDYGADGTASEDDDQAAFAAAILALPATGGTVYCPTGTYTLVTALDLADNVRILGDGPGTVIRSGLTQWINRGDSTGLGMLSMNGNTGCQFENFAISGRSSEWSYNHATTSDYPKLIYARQSSNISVSNVIAKDCTFEGFWGDGSVTVTNCSFTNVGAMENPGSVAGEGLPALQFTGNGCIFDSCRFDGCGYATSLQAVGGITSNCEAINCVAGAFGFGDAGPVGNAIVANCRGQAEGNTTNTVHLFHFSGGTPEEGELIVSSCAADIKQGATDQMVKAFRFSTGKHVKMIGCAATIREQGRAVEIAASNTGREIELANNTFRVIGRARQSSGISATVNGTATDRIFTRGNRYFGFDATDYAIDFIAADTATCDVRARQEYVEAGYARYTYQAGVAKNFFAGELDGRLHNVDANPLSTGDFWELLAANKLFLEAAPAGSIGIQPDNSIDLSGQESKNRYTLVWTGGGGSTLHSVAGVKAGDILIFGIQNDSTARQIDFHHGVGNIYTKSGATTSIHTGTTPAGSGRIMFDVDDQLRLNEI